MTTKTLTILLQAAALLHLGLICAGASMPKAVGLRTNLAVLPEFIRRLFLVYYAFIGLMLVGFGTLTFVFAEAMARGEPVARGLCILLTAFWALRLIAAAFIFDVRPYLTNWFYRIGYQALNLAFIYILAVYVLAVFAGGAR
jgi:hypothetical protein